MEKDLTQRKVTMKKLPRFDYIVLGKSTKKKYYMTAITDAEVEQLETNFAILYDNTIEPDNKKDFIFETGNFVISSKDIILYGISTDKPDDTVIKKLDDVITHHAALTYPSIVNLNNLTCSDTLTPGGSSYKYYMYALGMIGAPKNIIIFNYGKG